MNVGLKMNTYEDKALLFTYDGVGYLENNVLSWATEDDNIEINLDKLSFKKSNLESILEISPNSCNLTLKSINQGVNIPYKFINFDWQEKRLEISYQLESQELPIKIEIEIEGVNHEI